MKKLFFSICIFIFSVFLVYITGTFLADNSNILEWTETGQNYFISVVINLTLFGTLWMSSQPWAQTAGAEETSSIYKTKIFRYNVLIAFSIDPAR